MAQAHKTIIDHIEQYLGTIQRAWNKTPEGEKMDPQIVECAGGLVDYSRAFCTVGLSRHKLSPNALNGCPIRQELVILVPEDFEGRTIPALLQQLSSDVLRRHRAFLRGDCIERSNPIFRGKPFYAFLALPPAVLPDDFAVYTDEANNGIVFVLMVPIAKNEAGFVRTNGWSKLEGIFVAQHTDVVDLNRCSVIKE
jgi:hypothetical protein